MKKLSINTIIAILTFCLGIGMTSLWLIYATAENSSAIPPINNNDKNKKTLEMVFVLDTTGSMGGLIEGAKQRIWGVVNEVMQSDSKPNVRVGLIAYRDKGDAYVTQVLPITEDLDKVYTTLMDYRADGGGDTPENVRGALLAGVRNAGWSQSSTNIAQIVFLVGDAPPHEDYNDVQDSVTTAAEALRKGMIVNTIQCGNDSKTKKFWQDIAQRGQGQYFLIPQDGGVQTITTPFDERLAELGNQLGQTYVAYGGGAGAAGATYRETAKMEQAASEDKVATDAPKTAQADRAYNKAINSSAYVGDLLQDIESGKRKLDDVKDEDLPDDLKKLSLAERKKEIEKRLAERKKMRDEIVALSKKRSEYISAERKKQGTQNGFDFAVASALKEQLAKKGIK